MTDEKAPKFEDITSEVYPDREKPERTLSFGESFAHVRCLSKITGAVNNSLYFQLVFAASLLIFPF